MASIRVMSKAFDAELGVTSTSDDCSLSVIARQSHGRVGQTLGRHCMHSMQKIEIEIKCVSGAGDMTLMKYFSFTPT